MAYETKNSGNNLIHKSGFIREDKTGKVDYTLVPTDMLKRVAQLYTRGAKIYGRFNWANAKGEDELALYKQSAFRHFIQWQNGENDEDHMAAVVFNLFGYEHCKKNSNKGGGIPTVNDEKYYDGGPIDIYDSFPKGG